MTKNTGPRRFKDVVKNTLFRIFAEKRVVYEKGERVEKMVRSKDYSIYKKMGESHSTNLAGKDVILSSSDLVLPYVKKAG